MYAIRQYEFGDPGTLRHEHVDDPVAGPGQLRIKVHAAGVHLIDTAIRAGAATGHPFAKPELPMTPGREVAGTVDQVGPGVDPAWIGRRVVTHLGIASGGYAELAVREADAVHPIPDGVDARAAVAMIGTGRTAIGILDRAALSGDDVVLVTAAAGGIGELLVQAAHHAGATVIGVAGGPAKADRVGKLTSGVIAVDYHLPDWAEQLRAALAGRTVTVGFDGVGGAAGRAALELLGPGGRHIMFGWSSGEPTALSAADIVRAGITVTAALGPVLTSRAGGLRGLETAALEAITEGRLVPSTQGYPLAEAAQAHDDLEHRRTTGKVVLLTDCTVAVPA
jgi:NADPH2:quinone reductase